MKSCQATFCTLLTICQKWAHFIRKVKLYNFIENTLKIDHNGRNFNIIETIFAYGEYRQNFNETVCFHVEHYPNVGLTKFKVQRIVNLFEDTGSVLFRTRNLGQHFLDISKKKYVNRSLVSLINDSY
jgi:hypothetical protein